jgi:glycosyltransferase involved in cell wall biosynthesis
MTRILHIARYRNEMMEQKLAFMAEETDLVFSLVRPVHYADLFGPRNNIPSPQNIHNILRVRLMGRSDDPHRAFYGTLTFAMRRFKPHLIHAEEEPDSLSALQIVLAQKIFAPRSKLILHTYQNVNRPKSSAVKWVMSKTLKGARAILCANTAAAQVLREQGFKGPTEVIPHEGIDTDTFSPPETRTETGNFTVLYAGRLVPEKDLDTLLDAIHLLGGDVSLILVGEGPERAELENKTRVLGLARQVTFLGARRAEEMPNLFARTDVLVLPSRHSHVWKEQFGRVLLEAMACKIPVVGSDSGAIPEIIGTAGLVFREGDAQGLTTCLMRLRDSKELCKELAERGYLRVHTSYSQKVVARKTAEFYRKAAAWPF